MLLLGPENYPSRKNRGRIFETADLNVLKSNANCTFNTKKIK
jgi:hypothetical protein